MRRKDREVIDSEYFHEVLRSSEVITIAFNDGEYPYSVPLSFVEFDGAIYFHCALEGKKLECIARDPHVHFTAVEYLGVDRVKATVYYRSLCGTGIAEVLSDEEQKIAALKALMEKYSSGCDQPSSMWCRTTCIVRINVTSFIGKQHLKSA